LRCRSPGRETRERAGWDVVPTWRSAEWGFVVVSGILHVLYYVALLRGYRNADLTVVYPLARGSGPLLRLPGPAFPGDSPSRAALGHSLCPSRPFSGALCTQRECFIGTGRGGRSELGRRRLARCGV
jgi:hypothetical protein